MAKSVVGLFENRSDAQAALHDLQNAGFSGNNVSLVESATGRLAGALTSAGIPQEDAAIYADGVQSGGSLIVVQAVPDAEASRAADILDRHNVVDISRRGQVSRQTTTARDTAPTGTTGTTRAGSSNTNLYQGGEAVIPIIEEEIRVGKREVESGGVRVETRVEETPVQEQVTLRDETVQVERVPVNRPVDPSTLRDPDEAFIPVNVEVRERDEVPVVEKQARVVEEVVIDKETQERTETIQDTVRRTDVDVEEIPGQTRASGVTETSRTRRSDVGDRDRRDNY